MASRATAEARSAARDGKRSDDEAIDRIIDMHVLGISADYVNAMRAISPSLRALDAEDFSGMKAVGVTPEYARGLAAAGFRNLGEDDLTSARAVGLSIDYARALARAGLPPDIDDYIQLRAVGVPAQFVAGLRNAGYRVVDVDKIVELWAVGVRPGALHHNPPPLRPPVPDPDDDG
jgi:hypothetical protein